MNTYAKLQIGTTHELATVPNLPLLPNLHQKLCGLRHHELSGSMACWNFGCSLTLNTTAWAMFVEAPDEQLDSAVFLPELARLYFGKDIDVSSVMNAWNAFTGAFDHYPYSMRMLYYSPINYAPAYPLTTEYRDTPLGWSWVDHQPWGDRIEDCLPPFSLAQAIAMFDALRGQWHEGLVAYRASLIECNDSGIDCPSTLRRHRREELNTAEMIELHFRAMVNIMRFAKWRETTIKRTGLSAPCTLPMDDAACAIMKDHLDVMQRAEKLTCRDPRLGFHQEARAYLCGPDRIRRGLHCIQQTLDSYAQFRATSLLKSS